MKTRGFDELIWHSGYTRLYTVAAGFTPREELRPSRGRNEKVGRITIVKPS